MMLGDCLMDLLQPLYTVTLYTSSAAHGTHGMQHHIITVTLLVYTCLLAMQTHPSGCCRSACVLSPPQIDTDSLAVTAETSRH